MYNYRTPMKFSIIIPTRNREVQLAQCLRAIEKLEYPRGQFEVVVVADGVKVAVPPGVRIVYQYPHGGPALARNLGASKADGEYLVFTDDDCQPSQHWLNVIESHLVADPRSIVGGSIRNAIPQNPYSTATQVIIDFLYQSAPQFIATSNLTVSKRDFLELGGFDSSWRVAGGEDREFCWRWIKSGRSLRLASDAVVDHYHELSLSSFWYQHFRYGQGARWFRHRHGVPSGNPHFYLSLLRYSAARGCLTLVLFAQAAIAAGIARQRFRH